MWTENEKEQGEMEILTADDVTQGLIDIDRRRREAWKKKTEVQDKLGLSKNRLLTDEADRKGKLGLLAGAEDDAMRGYLENDIDELDKNIAAHHRMIEAYEGAVARIEIELKNIQEQLNALNKAVEDQERREAFDAWTVEYQRTAQAAVAAIDGARVALARLAIIGRRCDEFDKIGNFIGSLHRDRILGEFFNQVPPGSRGFDKVHGPRSAEMQCVIWPSARKKDLQ
jgi:uncharacterized coiled-coil protein SlyX